MQIFVKNVEVFPGCVAPKMLEENFVIKKEK
jgi:hypothetical protein